MSIITRRLWLAGPVLLWLAGSANAASVLSSPRKENLMAPRSSSSGGVSTKKNNLAEAVACLARGGGGIPRIDPELAGKILTAAYLASGSSFVLAPKRMGELYSSEPSGAYEYILESYGMMGVSAGIMAYALLIQGSSTNTAIGSAYVALAVFTLGAILNDKGGKLGFPRGADWVNLPLQSLAAYGMLTDQGYATNLVKAFSYIDIVSGVASRVATYQFLSLSGLKDEKLKNDADFVGKIHLFGYLLLGFSTMTLLLLNGQDPLKAFAYAGLFNLLSVIDMIFISKDADVWGNYKSPLYAWIVFFTVICGSMFFPGSEEVMAEV